MKLSKTLNPFLMYLNIPSASNLSSISTANSPLKNILLYSRTIVKVSGCQSQIIVRHCHKRKYSSHKNSSGRSFRRLIQRNNHLLLQNKLKLKYVTNYISNNSLRECNKFYKDHQKLYIKKEHWRRGWLTRLRVC